MFNILKKKFILFHQYKHNFLLHIYDNLTMSEHFTWDLPSNPYTEQRSTLAKAWKILACFTWVQGLVFEELLRMSRQIVP
jgi:hypothetical protein